MRTDSQGALREFESQTLPGHIHTALTDYMSKHPHLTVELEWIPGHQGIQGNERAHALARDSEPPGPPSPWPEPYNPKEDRAEKHKERRRYLRERCSQRCTLPSPSKLLSRADATYVRQAQTLSLPCDLYHHYIQNRPGQPKCQVCGDYPSNTHTYWACPRATSSPTYLPRNLLPPTLPYSLASWAAPPQELQQTLWPLLAQHIRRIISPPEANPQRPPADVEDSSLSSGED